ncbi:MAG: nucleotide sugar dehydrogenase [bacterium]
MQTRQPILVVGAGFVGLATATFLAGLGYRVTVAEKNPYTVESLSDGRLHFREPLLAAKFSSVVQRNRLTIVRPSRDLFVNAPMIIIAIDSVDPADWSMRTNDFERMASWIGHSERRQRGVVILKSTNILGFSQWFAGELGRTPSGAMLELAVCPEFLREGLAFEDTAKPWRVVVGADAAGTRRSVTSFYRRIYGRRIPIVTVDSRAAELIKLSSNLYLSHRLAFIHEVAEYARRHDLDMAAIGRGIGLDPRIGQEYFRPGLGFGGSCLPKDCHLINAGELGQKFTFESARTALAVNQSVLDGVVDSLKDRLGNLRGRRIAFWGVAFKPESDDVRGSTAVGLALMLRRRGARVSLHDPYLIGAEKITQGNLPLIGDRAQVLSGASALVIGTAHRRFKNWKASEAASIMKSKVVVDRYGLLSRRSWEKAGFEFV